MDFFDTIEQYENKLGDDIRKRLDLFLDALSLLPNYNNDNDTDDNDVYNKELIDEIESSQPLNQMFFNKKKRKVRIFALNKTQIKPMTNCFNQKGLLPEQCEKYFNKKTEVEVMKNTLMNILHQDIKEIFHEEVTKPNYNPSHNTNSNVNSKNNSNTMLKLLKPIKKNRYKEYIANCNNCNANANVRKKNQEYCKENRYTKIKQEANGNGNMQLKQQHQQHQQHQQLIINQQQLLLQHKKKVFQWKDDELIMKMNDGRNKFNLDNKYGTKGKNSKRILSCRVIIQDKKS